MDLFKLAIQLIGLVLGVVTFIIGISLGLGVISIILHILGRAEWANKVEALNVKLWNGVKSGIKSLVSRFRNKE